MQVRELLTGMAGGRIEFATMRPEDSDYATLERRVVITAPPSAVALSQTQEVDVIEQLVELLKDPITAWPAIVLLAAMTRREEKTVDAFARNPDEWWDSVGKTAFESWSKWLAEVREKLEWDPEKNMFVVKD